MPKVVVNRCFGGFGLSDAAYDMLEKMDNTWPEIANRYNGDVPRDNPALIAVVEKLGDKANGDYAKLRIVEVPDNVNWHIEEYDGPEHVAEDHQTW